MGELAIPLLIGGTVVSALGQLQAGAAAEAEMQSAQNIANFNAAVMDREAEARRQKATFEQQQQAKRAARVKSALTAGIAAAGGLGSPVAADLAAEQAAELELENLLIGYEGEVGAQQALSQAELDRLQGRLFRQKGKTLRQASYFRAGSTLLTGFGTVGSMRGGGGGGGTSWAQSGTGKMGLASGYGGGYSMR